MAEVKDLLNNAFNQKPSEFYSTFNDLILDRIQTAVANKKIEVAQSLFGSDKSNKETEEENEENS